MARLAGDVSFPVARLVRVEGELPPAPSTETWFGGSG
jgi:hypothetical protein